MFARLLTAAAVATILSTPMSAVAEQSMAYGSFTGASDHITTGGIKVIKTADGGALIMLDTDFSLDGAPDPRVGFGKDGEYDPASDVGALKDLTGMQTYAVPASINVDDFNEVYIWCKQFSVPLGVAALAKY